LTLRQLSLTILQLVKVRFYDGHIFYMPLFTLVNRRPVTANTGQTK